MRYLKQKGSGILSVVGPVAGDTQAAVAAGDVVWVGRCAQAPGCMASAVVSKLANESGTVHAAVVR
jgi:hypothetical protein